MASKKPIDSKKEEFRKYVESKKEEFRNYLQETGAMDGLTIALVLLYNEPEKPADALEYIRNHLEDEDMEGYTELNVLKTELNEARFKIFTLEDEVKFLKEKLAQYEPAETKKTMEKRVGGEPGTVVQSEASLPNAKVTKSVGKCTIYASASSSKPAGASSSKRAQ